MTLAFMVLFVVFLVLGPLYWWLRNFCRQIFKVNNFYWNKSIKYVWIVTTLIGIAFGFMAILI